MEAYLCRTPLALISDLDIMNTSLAQDCHLRMSGIWNCRFAQWVCGACNPVHRTAGDRPGDGIRIEPDHDQPAICTIEYGLGNEP